VPQPKPEPPKPKPPPPKPEPIKPPTTIKPVPPPPKPEPIKPQTTIKPVPLPPKAEPAKPKPPENSTWKPRTAAEIRKDAKLTPIKPLPPKGPSIDPNALASKIRDRVRNVSVAAVPAGSTARPGSADGVAAVAGPETARYFDLVSARLYEMWDQPTRASVGGGQPRVTVHVTVLPDGQVAATRIDRNSGVAAMDTSVAVVLKKLSRLPAYRDFGITAPKLSIEVMFELD
jgi:colicin import membrane protein